METNDRVFWKARITILAAKDFPKISQSTFQAHKSFNRLNQEIYLLFKLINLLIQTIQIDLVVCHFHISQILRVSLRMANFLLFELYFCFKDHQT